MSSLVFFLIYFIPATFIFLLALSMPVRRFEKWPIILIAAALPLSVINGILMNQYRGELNDVPLSLALDLAVIYLCINMLKMRRAGSPVLGIILTSVLSIIMTLMRLSTDVQVLVANFMEIATAVNAVFICQLILVAILCVEYMMYQKGWLRIKPVNYFTIARENKERVASPHYNGTIGPPTRRQSEHRDR